MATNVSVQGIDPGSWRVTILPLPKGFSRGCAYGFCGGYPVGRAERLRAPAVGSWWPGGEPEHLAASPAHFPLPVKLTTPIPVTHAGTGS